MAATKSTTKKTAKAKTTASKTTAASVTTAATTGAKKKTTKTVKKPSVAKAGKTSKTKTNKTSASKTKTSAKKSTKSTKNNLVATFLTSVVKQANKTQKAAQAQTKVWIKKLNAQDKQLAQLTKKVAKARPKTRTALDKKISKLEAEMSITRTGLLAAENAADKVATFIEWTTQLNEKPTTTAYLQTAAQTPSRPTLVKSSSSKPSKTANYEEYPEEIEEEDLNFVFGDDDDLDEEIGR